jgi:phosphoribosylpyrophosphate synthetase
LDEKTERSEKFELEELMNIKRPLIFHYPTVSAEIVRQTSEIGDQGVIEWESFPDGWPNLLVAGQDEDILRNRNVVFLASFDNPQAIFEQLAVIYALPRYLINSLHVILPFFPVGTMDRISKKGEIVTAKTLARMLSATPLTKRGPAVFTIYDIHALQEQFYPGDFILPDLQTAMPLLKRKINELEKVAIAFPDDGAKKRFGDMFPGYRKIICNKVRVGSEKIVTIKEGDPRGRHCVIADDLIQLGGTTIGCRNALMDAGAEKVSVFVPHGVFPKESWKKFLGGLFEHVWITDSCPVMANTLKDVRPFEVLTLAPLICRNILEQLA